MLDGRPVIAVFGAGRIGRVHAANVARAPGAVFAGIADLDTTAALRVISDNKQGRLDSVEEFLSDPSIDGVVIATPSDTHPTLIDQAARANKAIFCEKPISLDLNTTAEAIRTCERASVPLQIGFQRRFDEDFVNARNAIASGKLGDIRYLRLVGRDRVVPPIAYIRTSGGQFKDQMIHDFDAARWLLEPVPVDEVSATGSALADAAIGEVGDVDTAVACLKFANGAIAVIEASREAVYGYDTRSEVHGSRGLLLSGYENFTPGRIADATYLTERTDSFATRFSDAYRAEIENFIEVVARRAQPRATGRDALEALRLAVAADQARASKRCVKLSDIECAAV